jgi:hypothetical protein
VPRRAWQSQAFRTNRDSDIANDIGIALVDDIDGEINVATPSVAVAVADRFQPDYLATVYCRFHD